MSLNLSSNIHLSDSDNEQYKVELTKRRTEVETLLWQQEEKE